MESPGAGGDGLTGDEIYCICRSTDCSRFMIGCDKCNEWYHGDCINITQEESSHIKHFYCHLCRGKDPNLKIKYKHKKKKEKEKEKLRKDKDKSRRDKDKKHRSDKHHDRHKDHVKKKRSEKPKSSDPSKKHKDGEKSKDREKSKEVKPKEVKVEEKPAGLDKPVIEKPEDLDLLGDLSDLENEEDADMEEPTEEELKKLLSGMLPSDMLLSRVAAAKKSARRCGQCESCHRTEDCSRCDFCKDMRKFGGPNKIRQKCRLRQCVNFGLLKSQALKMKAALAEKALAEKALANVLPESENENVSGKYHRGTPKKDRRSDSDYGTPGRKKGKEKGRKADKKQKKVTKKEPKRPRGKRKAEEDFDDMMFKVEEEQSPRQCLGPGCVELAREGSKYCSDDCGMKLATNRIFEILPQRIQQWQSIPCLAENNNKRTLEAIRSKQLLARQKLVELDLKHQELDDLITRAKHTVPDTDQENTDGDEEGENSIHCVTCGHEISQRSAIRHMERCFVKFESQTSYGSIYKTKIEGNSMFCDYYNSHAKTYCKRLKVLCPEHSKEPKIGPNEVCGCPLKSKMLEGTNELCKLPKQKCTKHFTWEKLRRAEIDLERVRQWMKIDDLFEQERHIRVAMSSRAGVLGLMLHQTIDHNPLKPIKSK